MAYKMKSPLKQKTLFGTLLSMAGGGSDDHSGWSSENPSSTDKPATKSSSKPIKTLDINPGTPPPRHRDDTKIAPDPSSSDKPKTKKKVKTVDKPVDKPVTNKQTSMNEESRKAINEGKSTLSLGVDLKMPKFEGTVSRATDPGHDIIKQNSSYGGRVGRVKRRQERRTARVADRVDNRIGRMQGKQQIRDIRSTEQGKRDEKRESVSQERKNLLTDNPVVKDATGGREGSQPGKTITNKRTAKGVKVEKEPKLRGRDKRTAKFTAELGNTINPNAAKATPRGAKTINPTTSTPKARTSREDRGKPEKPSDYHRGRGTSPSATRLNLITSGSKSYRPDNVWNPKNTGMPSSSSEVKGSNMTGSTSWGGASNYNKAASAAIDASRAISGGSSSKPKSTKREGTFDYSQSSKTLRKKYKK